MTSPDSLLGSSHCHRILINLRSRLPQWQTGGIGSLCDGAFLNHNRVIDCPMPPRMCCWEVGGLVGLRLKGWGEDMMPNEKWLIWIQQSTGGGVCNLWVDWGAKLDKIPAGMVEINSMSLGQCEGSYCYWICFWVNWLLLDGWAHRSDNHQSIMEGKTTMCPLMRVVTSLSRKLMDTS